MKYKDVEFQISKDSINHYRASALENGRTAAEQTFELRMSELKVLEGLQRLEEKAVSTSEKETFHIEFGRELYKKVFSGRLGEYFRNCLEKGQKSGEGIRISLRFDESAHELAALPWELLETKAKAN